MQHRNISLCSVSLTATDSEHFFHKLIYHFCTVWIIFSSFMCYLLHMSKWNAHLVVDFWEISKCWNFMTSKFSSFFLWQFVFRHQITNTHTFIFLPSVVSSCKLYIPGHDLFSSTIYLVWGLGQGLFIAVHSQEKACSSATELFI